jgi:hypothetical protein
MVPEELRPAVGAIVAAVGIALLVGGWRALEGRARWGWVVGVLGWIALTGALAARGMFARFDPPLAPVLVVTGLVGGIAIARSSIGERLAGLPIAALIGLQVFRFPLELAMGHGAGRGVPIELTFWGWNFDIVTGAGALVLAILAAVGRCPAWLARAWCVVGLACLIVIAIVAGATLPPVHAFGTDPAHLNTWIGHLPFSWVPTLLVPVAVTGHLIVLRATGRARRTIN